jgi:hypothetical protein
MAYVLLLDVMIGTCRICGEEALFGVNPVSN